MPDNEFRPSADDMADARAQIPYPGKQTDMEPQPDSDLSNYRAAGKLRGKATLITGGDSGIGRAVAIAFGMEGAQVAILYNANDDDARETKRLVEDRGTTCLVIKADVRDADDVQRAIAEVVGTFGGLDVLVNNAAFQHEVLDLADLSEEQFTRTLTTNIGGVYRVTKAALPHLKAGASIVNTGSIVGEVGNPGLLDYCASKGAIHAFSKSLAAQLAPRNIRVNVVAPGPIWTPNIPGTMVPDEVRSFGGETPMGRPGQPEEVAPAYVYFASSDSTFTTGTILEIAGGKTSNT